MSHTSFANCGGNSDGQNSNGSPTEFIKIVDKGWRLTERECETLQLDLLQNVQGALRVEDHERRRANPLI